ncbi:hypothetical protein ACA910_011876 [Epithemia clementina (nom. ined.)]
MDQHRQQQPSLGQNNTHSFLGGSTNDGAMKRIRGGADHHPYYHHNYRLEEFWGHPRPSSTWSIVAGTLAFGSTLALSTLTQQRILRISTGTLAPIPSLVGFATVCVASLAAHKAAIAAYSYQYNHHLQALQGRLPQYNPLLMVGQDALHFLSQQAQETWEYWREQPPSLSEVKKKAKAFLFCQRRNDEYVDLKFLHLSMHTIRICAVGLLAFKLLGGRFWAIAPSSYTHVGSFARFSLPATEHYATAAKRAKLELLGRTIGCHTCGSRRLGASFRRILLFWKKKPAGGVSSHNFVGDHMPPKSVAAQLNERFHRKYLGFPKVQYRFYPQCVKCSGQQGGLLAAATDKLRNQSKLLRNSWSYRFGFRRPLSLASAGGGVHSHFHGLRPRVNHLTGGVIGGLAVTGATSAYEILEDDNRKRYRQYQRQIGKEVNKCFGYFGLKPPSWEW